MNHQRVFIKFVSFWCIFHHMGMCRRVMLSPASAKGRSGNSYGKACDPTSLGKKRRRADGEVLPLFYPLATLLLLPRALPGSHAAGNKTREAKLHPERQQGPITRPPVAQPHQLSLQNRPESAPAGWKMKAGPFAPLLHLPK